MEDVTELFDFALIFHICIVACFVVLGGFENFVIIFMLHKKKRLQTGQKLMLCLAYVDFFACVYCAPMIPVNIYLYGTSETMDHLLILVYQMPYSTVAITYIFVTITMALDRLHATSRPYSYKKPTMTSFLWIFVATGILEVLVVCTLIGWLPEIVIKIQGSTVCVLALLVIVPSYTVVVYKVKNQGKKIAAPSHSSAPSGIASGVFATKADNSKSEALPSAAEVPTIGATPVRGDGTSGQLTAAAADQTVSRKKREPKLETRMLKLCLGITCLFAVSYAALITRIVLNMSHNLNYVYSLNHVGNPVIYCMISKAYRKDVIDTVRLIVGNIKKTLTCSATY